MAEPVAIRDAGPGDVAAIARVHVRAWRESYAGLVRPDILAGLSIEDRAAMWRSALDPPRPRFKVSVAEAGGTAVGFAAAGPARPGADPARSAADPARPGPLGTEAEIFAIYLLDAVKRRGIGRRLTAAVFAHLRAEGFGSAGLWVLADNVPARRFYEALGGVAGPTREDSFKGQPLREIAYRFEPIPAH